MISAVVKQALLKHMSVTEQIKFAISQNWDLDSAFDVFGNHSTAVKAKALIANGGMVEYDGKLVTTDDTIVKALSSNVLAPYPSALKPRPFLRKAAVAAANTVNNPSLVYPGQAAGVLVPPTTISIIETLSKGGAANLPPNTRLVTQAVGLTAAQVPEEAPTPAAAPDVEFRLTSSERKFGLILTVTSEMIALSNVNNDVIAYLEQQLTDAANNATDEFFVGLMDAGGTAATSVAAAMAAFVGDLRSAVWVGSPQTLATLQDAANPNIGPLGGTYKTLPALPSLAADEGKLYLVDRKRVAVFDGPMTIEMTETASIVMDSAPGTATSGPVHLFQTGMTALKINKYADANLLSAPQVITL